MLNKYLGIIVIGVTATPLLHAQVDSFTLASGTVSGGTVTLALSLNSAGSEPAAVQWTLTYSSSNVASVTAVAGASLTSAAKTLSCAASAGSYTCVANGMNTNVIANGVLASITFTMTAAASTTPVTLAAVAVDPSGGTLNVSATGGTISGSGTGSGSGSSSSTSSSGGSGSGSNTAGGMNVSSVACNPATLIGGSSTTCTVTLTEAAGTGGQVVSLFALTTGNIEPASAPASITIPAGKQSGTFVVTTSAVTSNITVLVGGEIGTLGTDTSVVVTPGSAGSLSSLQCAPGTLTGGGSSTCTITLSAAASSSAVVTLTDNSASATEPGSVTIPAGASSGTFAVSTSAVSSAVTVTITASYNGTTVTASIAIQPPTVSPTLSSVACAPETVVATEPSTCTITLSGVAPAGGAVVTITDNSAAASEPATVTIAAGTSSTTFTTSTVSVASTQSVTLTASFAGSSKTAALTVVPAMILSSVTCTLPAANGAFIMRNSSTAACTATLNGATLANQTFTLASSVAALTVPASLTVPAGSSSAGFTAQSGTLSASTQKAAINATGYGSSASFNLTLSILVSSLTCNPQAISAELAGTGNPVGTTTCTITLSQASPAALPVAVTTSSSANLPVPATVTVPGGAGSATFAATTPTIYPSVQVTLAAAYSGFSQTFTVSTGFPGAASLVCAPATLLALGSATCTLTLTSPIPAGGTHPASISSSSSLLSVPSSLNIPALSSSGTFTATALAGFVAPAEITAADGGSVTFTFSKSSAAARPAGPSTGSAGSSPPQLFCLPRTVTAPGKVTCELQLASRSAKARDLALSSSHLSLHVPDTVTVRPNQSSLSFQAIVDETAPSGTLSIESSPGDRSAGDRSSEERITVIAQVVSGQVAPPRNTADTAAGAASGAPQIRSVGNAASGSAESVCAAGSLASIEGTGLARGEASDPSGGSLALAGTRVAVGGRYLPLIYASSAKVVFVCPAGGTAPMSISLETGDGRSVTASFASRESAPGIFTVDGSGQGQAAATIFNGSRLAMARNYRYSSEPAQPGDTMSIAVTGLSSGADPGRLSVVIGDLRVPVDDVHAVTGQAGVAQIALTIPSSAPTGDAVPIVVEERLPDGTAASSQKATIAIESIRR